MSIDKDKMRDVFKKAIRDADLIYQRMEMSGSIKMYRDGWKMKVEGFANMNEYIEWSKDNVQTVDDHNKQQQDVAGIMTKHGIPERYQAFVERSLVLAEKPDFYAIERPMPKVELVNDRNTGRQRLFVEVFADTKLEDFQDALFRHNLEDKQSKLHDYGTIKQRSAYSNENLKQLYLWKQQNKSYSEIRQLAKSELNFQISSDQAVGTYITRYKERVGLKKTPKSRK